MGRSTKLGKTRLDKYYHLAKEQGYRSRAAFKLIQLNKKYNFLNNAKVAIDLCAAPGGWLQVLAKEMPLGSKIIGLDLDTIRPIRGVTTFQQDITTQQCRQVLKRELVDWKVDVVVHDGAPNVGGAWAKDAYGQNELVLHSLKLATEFLIEGGWFVTKVFRSADYNALLWVFNQLFGKVEATKPLASRNTSAEIFVVCQGYLAPDKIDPKMLNPEYVFKQVEKMQKPVDVLHAKAGKRKRNRDGYNTDLGMTLHKKFSVAEWIKSTEPVRVLSEYQSLEWTKDTESEVLKRHPITTDEIKLCLKDLQVLGKKDFRNLLKWREGIIRHRDRVAGKVSLRSEDHLKNKSKIGDDDEEDVDEGVEQDKWLLRHLERKKRDQKRQKKKKAMKAAKERERLAMGMENIAVDIQDDEELFSLNQIRRKSDLDAIADVELGHGKFESHDMLDSDEEYSGTLPPSMRNMMVHHDATRISADDHEMQMNDEFEAEYEDYKRRRKQRESKPVLTGLAGGGAKGRRKREAATLEQIFQEEIIGGKSHQERYLQLLCGKDENGENKDEDASSDDSEESDIDETDRNPLLETSNFVGQNPSSRANRWFSNAIFDDLDDDNDDENKTVIKNAKVNADSQQKQSEKISAVERISNELASLPKSNRTKWKDKLQRIEERKRKRDEGREKRDSKGFTVIAREQDDDNNITDNIIDETKTDLSTRFGRRRARDALELKESIARQGANEALIRAGMGAKIDKSTVLASQAAYNSDSSDDEDERERKRVKVVSGFEVVKSKVSDATQKALDYFDDIEVGSTEHARTLAMGEIMLKHSKAKDLLDGTYNRFAFDDPEGLPSWFVDDENQHNRPQLPVTREMVEKIKARYVDLANKPIKKVAEARARKRFKAVQRMKKAKQRAEAIVNNDDLSAVSKMNAIRKAMKKAEVKKPGKCYVVNAGKGRKAKGGRGSKYATRVVDKRSKNDKRATKRNLDGKHKTNNRGKNQKRKSSHKKRRRK